MILVGNSRRFSALNTKIRALLAALLTEEDFVKLLGFSSVPEQYQYLMNQTAYRDVLTEYLDVYHFEKCLKIHLVKNMKKLRFFLYDRYRDFYDALMRLYEIEELVHVVKLFDKTEDFDRSQILTLSSAPIQEALASSQTLTGFLKALSNTDYYGRIKNYIEDESRVFYIEIILYQYYFEQLLASMQGLSKKDRDVVHEIYGRKADLYNISWIYRGLSFYPLLREELVNLTIHYGFRFQTKDIKALCYMELEELKETVIHTEYAFLYESDEESLMSRQIEKYFYHLTKKMLRSNQADISTLIAYYHHLESEVLDLTTLIETTRFGIGPEEKIRYLIRPLEEGVRPHGS